MSVAVVLHKHILEEFVLHNEMIDQKHAPMQLKPEIRFQVFPQKGNNPIATEMSLEIGNMDDGSPLYLKLRVRGLFLNIAQNQDEAKIDAKEFHKQAFVQLFNVVRTLIAGTTLMGGMTPFNLPPINPDNMNMQKND